IGDVDLAAWLQVEAEDAARLPYLARHADHAEPLAGAQADPAPEGILPGPVTLGHLLADHRDVRSRRDLGLLEVTSLRDGDAERGQPLGRRGVGEHGRAGGLRDRIPVPVPGGWRPPPAELVA